MQDAIDYNITLMNVKDEFHFLVSSKTLPDAPTPEAIVPFSKYAPVTP